MEKPCSRCLGKGTVHYPDCSFCQETGLEGSISAKGQYACFCHKGDFWVKQGYKRRERETLGE